MPLAGGRRGKTEGLPRFSGGGRKALSKFSPLIFRFSHAAISGEIDMLTSLKPFGGTGKPISPSSPHRSPRSGALPVRHLFAKGPRT